jgi:threonine/homoserine/homoserine lactone efflux protein
MTDLIWSFSPWLVFLLSSRFTSFSAALTLGFVASVVVLALAASVDARQVLLRVIVPFGALYLAYRYTINQQAQVRAAQPDPKVQSTRPI